MEGTGLLSRFVNLSRLRGHIYPISAQNDYLNTVFARELQKQCPLMVRTEKLQLVSILPLRVKRRSLQEMNVICRSPRQIEKYSLGSEKGFTCNIR